MYISTCPAQLHMCALKTEQENKNMSMELDSQRYIINQKESVANHD